MADRIVSLSCDFGRFVLNTQKPNTYKLYWIVMSQGSDFAPASKHDRADHPLFDWLRFVLASIVAMGHVGLSPWSEITRKTRRLSLLLAERADWQILLQTSFPDLPRFIFNRATQIWIPLLLYSYHLCTERAAGAALRSDGWSS